MLNITNELKAKLLAAKSAEEVTELLKTDGQEITPEDAARLWEEISRRRNQDGSELSPDELEAVSGGSDRDWLSDGCAATVDPDSLCWSDDYCIFIDVTYDNPPAKVCPYCGGYQLFMERVEFRVPGVYKEKKYWCSSCKRIEYVVDSSIPNGI